MMTESTSNEATKKATNTGLDDIAKYLVNDAYRQANEGRTFTPEEQVALAVHSSSVPLTERIADLKKLSKVVTDETIKKGIEVYLNICDRQLEMLDEYDRDSNVVYNDVYKSGSVTIANAYQTFNAMSMSTSDVEHDVYIQRMTPLDGAAELGRIHLIGGKVTKITLWIMYADMEVTRLFSIPVTIKSPYKPYDILRIPFDENITVVADISDEEAMSLVESGELESQGKGWLKMVVPLYKYDLEAGTKAIVVKTAFGSNLEYMTSVPEDEITNVMRSTVERLRALD